MQEILDYEHVCVCVDSKYLRKLVEGLVFDHVQANGKLVCTWTQTAQEIALVSIFTLHNETDTLYGCVRQHNFCNKFKGWTLCSLIVMILFRGLKEM